MLYERNRVADVLRSQSEKISSAFTFGRKSEHVSKGENIGDYFTEPDNFLLYFILSLSDDEIEGLNKLAEDEEEIVIHFFKEVDGKSEVFSAKDYLLSPFDHSWTASKPELGWDELRDVPEQSLSVTFLDW